MFLSLLVSSLAARFLVISLVRKLLFPVLWVLHWAGLGTDGWDASGNARGTHSVPLPAAPGAGKLCLP